MKNSKLDNKFVRFTDKNNNLNEGYCV
jgi:hypothetical protein